MRLRSFQIILIVIFLSFNSSLAGEKLRYQFQKDRVYKYSTVVSSKTVGQMIGQEFTIMTGANCEFSIVLAGVQEKVNELIVTFEKFEILIDMPMMGFNDSIMVMNEYIGKRIKAMLTDRGEILSIEPIDVIVPSDRNSIVNLAPSDLFKQILLELPETELDMNGSWKKELPSTTFTDGMKIVTNQKVEFKVAEKEKRKSFNCWKINVNGTGVIEGGGSKGGNNVAIDGNSKISGTVYIAPAEGLFISSENYNETDMTTTVTGSETGASTMFVSTTVKTDLMK